MTNKKLFVFKRQNENNNRCFRPLQFNYSIEQQEISLRFIIEQAETNNSIYTIQLFTYLTSLHFTTVLFDTFQLQQHLH